MEEGGVGTGVALGAFVAKNAAFGVESGRYEIREMDFGKACRPSSVIHQDRTSSDPHYPPNTTEPNPKHLRGTSTHLVEPIINTDERGVGGDGRR